MSTINLSAEHEMLLPIHRAFHGMMNGPLSTSMREKGLTYKVNFGVELPRLQEYAKTLPHTHELAQVLFKENIRESRLLAPMLMPIERFSPELADVWIESMQFTEEASACVHFLFSRLPYASQKAFEWIAREEWMFQFCGFQLLGNLFGQDMTPSPRDMEEYLDQAATALRSERLAIRSAAHKSLLKFMNLSDEATDKANDLLDMAGM